MTECTPAVSIVVCTRDRVSSLIARLPSIVDAASASSRDTEIIVVDNGSVDGTTKEVARRFPTVLLVHEGAPGISIARNTGVRAAKAPVILFTDDDVEVPLDWVNRLSAPLIAGAAEIVVGGISVDESLRRTWMSPWLLQNFAHYPEQQSVDPGVVGANFGALKTVLLEIPFDERLGAAPYQRHEDGFFGVQARERGFRIVGVAGDPVVHHFDPSRLQRSAIHALAARAGRGSGYIWYHWAYGVAPHLFVKSVVFRLTRIATLPWLRRHQSDRDLKLVAKIAFIDELRRIEGSPRNYPAPSVRLADPPSP
ncbi:glycosyltransferase [Microbacterium sp. ARD31]|uniref:glycosyltransferase family 2 protein n=1 Tax=Microbacterium sp. ARD31 TaxID=2962576 RepID=UPI002881F9BA|nr:glycosyltransferase [Microbacterium sp. ARD31]MDT0186462.1 glycosyltransferase [Microbacterium sp. ARD31]